MQVMILLKEFVKRASSTDTKNICKGRLSVAFFRTGRFGVDMP